MCTVTFLPLNKTDFILTSSRDIPFSREKALHPKKYIEDGVELNYPKDGKAGGSWIGSSSKNRLICLLNGGYVYHKSLARYKKSRGLIVKELLKTDDIRKGLNAIDLNEVEQFTLVIVDWNEGLKLMEFVWDGEEKYLKIKEKEPQIWSSSTLYTQEMKQLRRDWFNEWLQENEKFSQKDIFDFHTDETKGTADVSLKMKRLQVKTVSVTTVLKEGNKTGMKYQPFV